MAIASAIIAAVVGAAGAAYSAGEAVKSQKKAQKKALAQQERQTKVAREESETALRKLGDITAQGPGGPMFEFRKREELSALEAQMRAAGTWKSGRAIEATGRITGRLTAEESEAHVARLQSLADMGPGQTSTAPITAAGQAEAGFQGVVGRQISGLAGTWEAERRRQEDEAKKRRLQLDLGRDIPGGSLSTGQIYPSIASA